MDRDTLVARALQPPLARFAAKVGSSLRHREMTSAAKREASLIFEFLVPLYMLGAGTMVFGTALAFAWSRNPIVATMFLGLTLLFALNAFVASGAVKQMRESMHG